MDSLSCGSACIKYILFAFNFIFAIIGIAIIALGALLVDASSDLNNDVATAIVLIVIGSISFLVAFFGCCGAIRESTCLIYTYSTFVMILLVVQAILGIVILVTIDDILASTNTAVVNLWNNRDSSNANSVSWNNVQRDYRCCGLNNPNQFLGALPASCCANVPCTLANAFQQGCQVAVRDNVDLYARVLAYIALGGAAVQLVGFIFSIILARSINNLS